MVTIVSFQGRCLGKQFIFENKLAKSYNNWLKLVSDHPPVSTLRYEKIKLRL
jgi:hypothetical protein